MPCIFVRLKDNKRMSNFRSEIGLFYSGLSRLTYGLLLFSIRRAGILLPCVDKVHMNVRLLEVKWTSN